MLREFSIRLRATDGRHDHHFIVPVRAATPEMAGGYAIRFIEDFYGVKVTDHLVRYKGRALPTWCEKAKRVTGDLGARMRGMKAAERERRQTRKAA